MRKQIRPAPGMNLTAEIKTGLRCVIEDLLSPIPTEHLRPGPHASFITPSGITLKAGDPVTTYVARNLEPHRGFNVFVRALERIQKAHPRCHALIVGGDGVSYGRPPPADAKAANWREYMLREVRLDPARTHFLGRVAYADYLKVLQVSAAHVYLTYPFVLSWSLLEAAVLGCRLVASDTAPVKEYLNPAEATRVVGFFDTKTITEVILDLMAKPCTSEWEAERTALMVRFAVKPKEYANFLCGN